VKGTIGCPLGKAAVMTEGCRFTTIIALSHLENPFRTRIASNRQPLSLRQQGWILPQGASFYKLRVKLEKVKNTMSEPTNPFGTIFISKRAITTIAAQSALESYGVVGLAAKNLADSLAQALVKDPALGVTVHYDGGQVQIDLYLIIEYGLRVTTVANSVIESVRYHIEKATGLVVKQVNVHVRGLRISNPD